MRHLDCFAKVWRSAPHEFAASLSYAKTLQVRTLFDRSVNRRVSRGPRKRTEIDMRGQVGASRIREHAGKGVVSNGLKGFTKRGSRMIVVDEQSSTAVTRDPGGDSPRETKHSGGDFRYFAVGITFT